MAVFSAYINRFGDNWFNVSDISWKTSASHMLVVGALAAWTLKVAHPLLYTSQQPIARIDRKDKLSIDLITSTSDDYENAKTYKLSKEGKFLITPQIKQHKHLSVKEPNLDKEFLKQFWQLLRIMIPSLNCREFGILSVHTICLISRTFLSLYVANLEGTIVKHIVRKDLQQFALVLIKWFGIAIPATFINSMIRFLENKLSLAFRTRLVHHSYNLYFKNQNYYRVGNLDGRILNADHRLTEDISVFSNCISHLYSCLTKPCFDLMLIGFALMRSSKNMTSNTFLGPSLALGVIAVTVYIMRLLSPKFGQMVAEEANRYGYLRHIHSRIITNAEEIAFYGGHEVESQQLCQAYNRLVKQMNYNFTQKLWFVMLEQFCMKYVWSGMGMIMVSTPILMENLKEEKNVQYGVLVSKRTQYVTIARNLLISAADAIERLMSSYKEILALAGYTHRVASMLNVFEETGQGIFKKATITESKQQEINNGLMESKKIKGRVIYTDIQQNKDISLRGVPVVTPNNDVVVPSLDLVIEPGMHVIITGPNGCGKSSLFRIISGLWPIYDGELRVPRTENGKPCMFYIPQRPYMSIGSLCDQIIYPDTRENMLEKGITENDLNRIIKLVSLEHLILRDSLHVVRDWKDILSGGEKQRMALARLFYHKPLYALLDECTSAVSVDVESSIYESAISMGITLLTITHRPSLWKFHTHILKFDGNGGWTFRQISSSNIIGQSSHGKPPRN